MWATFSCNFRLLHENVHDCLPNRLKKEKKKKEEKKKNPISVQALFSLSTLDGFQRNVRKPNKKLGGTL